MLRECGRAKKPALLILDGYESPGGRGTYRVQVTRMSPLYDSALGSKPGSLFGSFSLNIGGVGRNWQKTKMDDFSAKIHQKTDHDGKFP